MPDRFGDDDATVYEIPPLPTDAEVRKLAIQACDLCDPQGYIDTRVCDHIDHRPAAVRGMAEIRRRMGWSAK